MVDVIGTLWHSGVGRLMLAIAVLMLLVRFSFIWSWARLLWRGRERG